MSTEVREVRLEVYLNGVFYSADSYFALNDKHVQLEVEENEHISVCQVKDLQLEMNRNRKDSISDLKSPTLVSEDGPSVEVANDQPEENSQTESTAGWIFEKTSAVFQRLTAVFQTNTPNAVEEPEVDLIDPEESCVPDPTAPKPKPEVDLVDTKKSCLPEPEVDLVDTEQLCVPNPTIPEPKPETDLVHTKKSCLPEPEVDLVDTEQLCVPNPTIPEPKPEMDLVDPEELCAPYPSIPEPEPEVASELLRLENYVPPSVLQLEDRCSGCTLTNAPATEVWPGIFIGNEEIARDRNKLKKMGITHILNTAAPKKNLKFLLGMASEKDLLGTVNTGSRYYRGMHITYCGLPSSYRRCFDISEYFLPAAKFICKALRNPMSKVLIHCTKGLSHSVTLFLAYLMICHDMMVEDAIDHVIKVRHIWPYFGHLRQLTLLNADLVELRILKLQG